MLKQCRMGLVLGVLFVASVSWAGAPTYLASVLVDGKTPLRWVSVGRAVVVSIQPLPSRSRLQQQADVAGVKRAFSAWLQAMPQGALRLSYGNDPNQADIVVKWQPRLTGAKVGHQALRFEGKTITDATVLLALADSQGRALSAAEQQYTALHEVGHVLGLQGHSPSSQDVMSVSLNARIQALSARDKATMKALYGLPAGIHNPPSVSLMQYKRAMYSARLGRIAYQDGDTARALKQFLQAQAAYPAEPQLPYWVGMAALKQSQFALARQNLLEALKQQDKARQPQLVWALAHAEQGEGSSRLLKQPPDLSGLSLLRAARARFAHIAQSAAYDATQRQTAQAQIQALDKVLARLAR